MGWGLWRGLTSEKLPPPEFMHDFLLPIIWLYLHIPRYLAMPKRSFLVNNPILPSLEPSWFLSYCLSFFMHSSPRSGCILSSEHCWYLESWAKGLDDPAKLLHQKSSPPSAWLGKTPFLRIHCFLSAHGNMTASHDNVSAQVLLLSLVPENGYSRASERREALSSWPPGELKKDAVLGGQRM